MGKELLKKLKDIKKKVLDESSENSAMVQKEKELIEGVSVKMLQEA